MAPLCHMFIHFGYLTRTESRPQSMGYSYLPESSFLTLSKNPLVFQLSSGDVPRGPTSSVQTPLTLTQFVALYQFIFLVRIHTQAWPARGRLV